MMHPASFTPNQSESVSFTASFTRIRARECLSQRLSPESERESFSPYDFTMWLQVFARMQLEEARAFPLQQRTVGPIFWEPCCVHTRAHTHTHIRSQCLCPMQAVSGRQAHTPSLRAFTRTPFHHLWFAGCLAEVVMTSPQQVQ